MPFPKPFGFNLAFRRLHQADWRLELGRFLRFAAVGGLGTITDVGLLNLLRQSLGTPLYLANTISFSAAVVQNFILHRLWTFPNQPARTARRQLLKFTLTSVAGLGLNQIVFLGLHDMLLESWVLWIGSEPLAHTVSYNFAKLVSIGVILIWNFGANRFWTFRPGSGAASRDHSD